MQNTKTDSKRTVYMASLRAGFSICQNALFSGAAKSKVSVSHKLLTGVNRDRTDMTKRSIPAVIIHCMRDFSQSLNPTKRSSQLRTSGALGGCVHRWPLPCRSRHIPHRIHLFSNRQLSYTSSYTFPIRLSNSGLNECLKGRITTE